MHIEPTTRCTLECPACPRTWFSQKFNRTFPKQDLDLDALWTFLNCESGNAISKMTLCGNHGDPIYYPQLFELLNKFRDSKSYHIVTNGSYQKKDFWLELKDLLGPNDTITFSIDGLEHNNHLYRKNSDWQSIMQGLDIMVNGAAKVVWSTIVFSYNQNELGQIKQFAVDRGAEFVSVKSSRFGIESLQPQQSLIDTTKLYSSIKNKTIIEPRCRSEEYISADGFYFPCCYISTYYTLHSTSLWRNRQQWNIANQNLDSARIKLDQWIGNILNDPSSAHSVCKMQCGKIVDQ